MGGKTFCLRHRVEFDYRSARGALRLSVQNSDSKINVLAKTHPTLTDIHISWTLIYTHTETTKNTLWTNIINKKINIETDFNKS